MLPLNQELVMIRINKDLVIPEREIRFKFSRSGGPGGQNVNKVNTRVTLRFNVDASESLTEEQKALIRKRLSSRISRNGILMVTAGLHRTQKANRDAALKRFSQLMATALKKAIPRKKTRVGGAARERRLREKRHRSMIKKARRKSFESDW